MGQCDLYGRRRRQDVVMIPKPVRGSEDHADDVTACPTFPPNFRRRNILHRRVEIDALDRVADVAAVEHVVMLGSVMTM